MLLMLRMVMVFNHYSIISDGLDCLGWSSHAEKVLSIKPLKYVLAPMVVMVVVVEKTLIVAYLLLKANCL